MNTDKHNYKLTENDKKEIAISYYLDRSKNNIEHLTKKYNISRQYIYQLVKQEKTKELVKKSIIDDNQNFTKKLNNLIDKSLDKLSKKVEEDDFKRANYKDLAIMLGTLYDKSRLESNLSTENKAVEINIKIEK